MTDEQEVAYVQSQATCALIEAMGKHAENMQRAHCGESMAYVEADCFKLIEYYGIHHNGVFETFGRRD